MQYDDNIHTQRDDGILVATIDMPERTMNVFSAALMDSLEDVLDEAEANTAVRGLVLTSGKPTFLAGADLAMIRQFTDAARDRSTADLHQLCGRLGRLFLRLEQLGKPSVAAINGLALGGGLELALACHHRITADTPGLQLGLPEIRLGLLPGAGGTQRLPRLIDIDEALRMLLTGAPVDARQAQALGLIDDIVPAEQLLARACALINQPLRQQPAWYAPGFRAPRSPLRDNAAAGYAAVCRALGLDERQRKDYPAIDAILDCVATGLDQPIDAAVSLEMDIFVRLIQNPVAGNMVRALFLERQRAAREAARQGRLQPAPAVALIGANAQALRQQLAGTRLTLLPHEAEPGTHDITLSTDTAQPGTLYWLGKTGRLPAHSVGVWAADSSEHGQMMEIVQHGTPAQTSSVGAAWWLARTLGATAFVSQGEAPLLPRIAAAMAAAAEHGCEPQAQHLAGALCALDAWLKGQLPDPALLDSGAVLAGVFPAFTGGPFTWLRQHRSRLAALRSTAAARAGAALFPALTIEVLPDES